MSVTQDNFPQFNITKFNENNFSQIVDFVKPMWSFSQWEDNFRKIYVETIIRNNFFSQGLNFEIVEGKKLLSAMFLQRLSDKNNLNEWLEKLWIDFDEEKKTCLKNCADYLSYMDSKVHSFMNDNDIKLALFVSMEKGVGSVLFENIFQMLKNRGIKNMYLWTDCECNWEWYIKKGFELIEESVYEKFNKENVPYKTYVFKKSIG